MRTHRLLRLLQLGRLVPLAVERLWFFRFFRNTLGGRAALALALPLSLHLALYLALIAIPPRLDAVEAPGDLVRLREIYVPHEEFLRRSRQDPSGIIMSLREYRGLVLKALGRGEAGEAALPPLDAVVSRAEHEGVLRGHSVRLRSRLEVRVAREGWVACDLGLSIARPGEVTVDGAPGWIVQRPAAQPAPQGAHPPKGAAPTRDFLLLRGTGVHQVEIFHTLRAVESRDVWTLSGRLPASVTAHVIVVVPGHAEGSSDPPFLEARFLEPSGSQRAGSTRFDVALGGRQDFSITWRPRRALGMTDTLLAAEHRLTLLPRRSDPVAIWEVTVNVNRQETDQLALEEPAGVSVVRISGPHVHHWTQEGKTLHVVLNEARRGAIPLRLEGFLEPSGEPPAATEPQRFSVGGPRLLGAVSNVGSLAILDPAPERLEVDEVEGLREIALGEAPLPAVEGASGSAARLFSFPSPDVRIAFRTVPRPEAFEVRAACLLKVLDSTVSLEGVYRVDVQNGRVYRLELALPDPWRFRDVSVLRVAGQVAPAVRFEEVESDGSRRLEIGLSRALQAGSSIEFRLRVRHGGFDPQLGWEERQLEFRVPHFAAASRSHVDLGISLAPSIDAERVDEGSWKVLGREALQGVGLEDPHLVAGLTTGSPTEAVTLDLRHRSPRGEFESVTHLLALERRLRVRTDLRVAVVDRAVDELRLVLPVPVSVTPHFITPGLKETSATADGDERSIHVVRFTRPWLGTRQLRVEYEVEDHSPGESVPLPTVDLQGDFIGQAVVALQSLGPVELVVTRGAALEPIDLDELPDFGAPWKEGRSLFAFRVRERGDPGSFTTRVHPRAPVVASFAREVEITTVLDESGVSRTLVETLLAYSDRQNLEVKLPEDARPLEVVVGGEVVRSVRRSTAGRWSIPLPPVSYASISLLYERPYGSGEAPGAWGTWSESGPIFTGVPVGTTRWKLYHPPGYRFFLDGGNLQADEPLHEARPGHFARSIVWTLARGRLPLLTAFAPGGEGRRLHAPPGDAKAPPLHLVSFKPEGFLVAASKIGGEPRMVLSYHSLAWRRFAAPSVFVLTLVAGLALALGLDRRKFYSLVVWGLVYATLGSAVFEWLLDWQSPFLLLPLSEGLSSVLLASLVIDGARLASRRFRGATASCLVAGALVASSASALAEEPAKEPAKEPETMPAAADEVLVPYDPEDVTSLDEAHAKVYLPYEKFRALWRRAHPGEPVAGDEPEWDLIVGNVAYRLSVDGDTYRLSGRAAVQVMVERWLELPLPFENVQLSTVRLDGVEVGVSQKDDRPFVALRGQGAHTVEVELTGQVIRQQGVYRLLGDLLSGSATRIEVELPTGAEPLLTATGEFALEKRGEVSVVTADLGRTGRLDLRWHFPGTEGQRASQVESTSLSLLELTVDGYRVSRTERLRVSGEPVSSVEYRIDGDWRIARVAAPELSEWSVVEVEGTRRLQVFFYRDVREAQLDVEGWSPLGDGEGPVASLSLLGAARQESYFGLRHGARRRWTPDSLAGTRRTSVPELPPGLAIDPRERPDRLHHIYGSGQAERLAATALEGNVQLTTRSVLVVDPRRLLISSRSRYRVSGPGPFRQQITIPGSWSVLAARGDVLRDWETSEEGGNTIITFHLKRRARSSDELLWSAERQLDELPDPLALPALEISTTDQGLRSEVHHWAVAAHESLELSATGENGLTSLRPTGDVVWLQLPPRRRYRFAYRSTGLEPSYSLAIRASTPESQLRATVVTFARPAEERLHVNTRLVFRTLRAGRDRFRFRLPPGAELVSVETRNQKSRTVVATPEGTLAELLLIAPVLGDQVVDISYRIPRPEGPTAVVLRPVTVLDGESALAGDDIVHYVGVLRTGELTVTSEGDGDTGVEPVPPESLPYVPSGVSLSPGSTYRARQPDWSLTLRPELVKTVEEAAARVDLAEISTVLAQDGTLRSRAAFTLRNRELQFLRIELPPLAAVWGVTLNGRPVLVSRSETATGGAHLRVPLEHVGKGDLNLEVAVVYEERRVDLPSIKSLSLVSPRVIDLDVFKTLWSLELPEGYDVDVEDEGNMEPAASSVQHASKVESLVDQIQRLSGAASSTAASGRLRQRAAANLRQLQLALSDSVEDLENTLGGAARSEDARRLDRRVLEQQVSKSRELLERGRQESDQLREHFKKQDQEMARQQAAPEEEPRAAESIDEGFHFLDNLWRGGADPDRKTTSAAGGRAAGEIDLEALRSDSPFRGFLGTKAAGVESDVESSRARTVEVRSLSPLPETVAIPAQPALETPPAPTEAPRLSFQRMGGGAHIVLSLTSEATWSRVLATLLLLGALAIHAVILVRRS